MTRSQILDVIVVNDFRAVPIGAAVQLALRSNSRRFLISEASLLYNDFGDTSSKPHKLLVISLLRFFSEVEIVSSSSKDFVHPGYHGLRSSLISITNDVLASPDKYPHLAARMEHLVAGSLSLLRRVRELDPMNVYVFSGRTASSQPLASELNKSGERELKVYEWGGKIRRTFLVTDHPLHDTVAEAKRLLEWAQSVNFQFNGRRARKLIREKLTYHYDLPSDPEVRNDYATVLFAGSPHEHAVVEVNNLSVLDGDTLGLVDRCMSLGVLARPAAVRMHPNMVKDPSLGAQVAQLRQYLAPIGVDLISPMQRVSSRDLIDKTQNVVVGNSSVGLDAIFLGKNPIIVGHPPYKDLVEAVEKQFPGSCDNPLRIAGLLHDYNDPHVHQFGMRASFVWCALRGLEVFYDFTGYISRLFSKLKTWRRSKLVTKDALK